jgi:hypothetical protein
MRNLFLVLLLCNICFAGWQLWIEPEIARPFEPLVIGTEARLVMLPVDRAAQGSSVVSTANCSRFGPITEVSS